MERLTYWNEEYGCWSYHGPSGEAAKRLAAYEDTGLEPEEITQSLDAVREPVSIYEPVFSDGGDGGAVIADTVAIEGEEQTVIDRLLIEKLLSELSEREKKIIILRFFRDKTQSEIAKNMGVSQVQISRIITKALKKLRDNAAK